MLHNCSRYSFVNRGRLLKTVQLFTNIKLSFPGQKPDKLTNTNKNCVRVSKRQSRNLSPLEKIQKLLRNTRRAFLLIPNDVMLLKLCAHKLCTNICKKNLLSVHNVPGKRIPRYTSTPRRPNASLHFGGRFTG